MKRTKKMKYQFIDTNFLTLTVITVVTKMKLCSSNVSLTLNKDKK